MKFTSQLESGNQFIAKIGWLAAVFTGAFVAVIAKFNTEEIGMTWIVFALFGALVASVAYFAKFGAQLDDVLERRNREMIRMLGQISDHHMTYQEFGGSEYYSRVSATILEELKESVNGKKPEVWFTSFRSDSPISSEGIGESNKVLQKYHADLREWVTEGKITLRRIISVRTASKLGWVINMTKNLRISGYEMRLMNDFVSNDRPILPPSINVQLIGKDHVYLVTSTGQSRTGDGFIYIRSSVLNAILKDYYRNLWHYLENHALITDHTLHFDNLNELIRRFPEEEFEQFSPESS